MFRLKPTLRSPISSQTLISRCLTLDYFHHSCIRSWNMVLNGNSKYENLLWNLLTHESCRAELTFWSFDVVLFDMSLNSVNSELIIRHKLKICNFQFTWDMNHKSESEHSWNIKVLGREEEVYSRSSSIQMWKWQIEIPNYLWLLIQNTDNTI